MTPSSSPQTGRLGLLGCGGRLRGIVRRILENAPEGSIKVTAVYDPDSRSIEELRKNLGYDFAVMPSEVGVVESTAVDWVMIGSWNNAHAKQAVLALELGKNVFCEKPLATTFEDCLEIRDAVHASGSVFSFGLVLRYSPHYQKIREILDSGMLGQIVSFEFNETLSFNHGGYIFGDWRRMTELSGGHMLEKCCHDLDLANWFMDSLPVKIASFGGRDFFAEKNAKRVEEIGPNTEGFAAYSAWGAFAPDLLNPFTSGADIYDNQVAIVEYGNGARATFHTNCNAGIPERRMYILGSQGALRADLISGNMEVCRINWESKIEKIDIPESDMHGGGDQVMAKALVNTILHAAPPLASVKEGISSAVTAFAMDESCKEGRVVDVMPYWKKAGIDPRVP